MTTQTITAEGGEIELTTAESGEITATSADFAVYVVQQVEITGGVLPTGFSDRPAVDAGITYDFLEDVARHSRVAGEIFTGETSLTSLRPIICRKLGIGDVNEYLSDALYFKGSNAPQYGTTSGLSTGDATIIFAGRSEGPAAGTKAVAGIGSSSIMGWFTLCDVRSGVNAWNVSYYGGDFSTGVARRGVTGDVVIAHYNHATNQTHVWINGAKYTGAATLNILANSPYGFGNSPDNSFSWDFEGDIQYLSISQLAIDDSAAAAWTAWLQTRYGIAP